MKQNSQTHDEIEEVEAKEFIPDSSWERITKDKDIHQGMVAVTRTIINVGITLADTIPVVGEIASWSADALKSDTAKKFLKKAGLPDFDLTPSVSKKVAWATEILEVFTLGVMPSHAIETFLQFKREDLGHIQKALATLKSIQEADRRTRVRSKRTLKSI